MRRKKVEITDEISETIGYCLEPLPNDIADLEKELKELKDVISDLDKMKHTDYQKSRKHLLNIIQKSKQMRSNILDIHKIFTKEYD